MGDGTPTPSNIVMDSGTRWQAALLVTLTDLDTDELLDMTNLFAADVDQVSRVVQDMIKELPEYGANNVFGDTKQTMVTVDRQGAGLHVKLAVILPADLQAAQKLAQDLDWDMNVQCSDGGLADAGEIDLKDLGKTLYVNIEQMEQ